MSDTAEPMTTAPQSIAFIGLGAMGAPMAENLVKKQFRVTGFDMREAARDASWEFMGHGYVQMPMHNLEDQRGAISRTIEAISSFTGKRPRGWESPGLTETPDTVDLLAAEGIEYVADWILDDQPCEIATEFGKLISIPYTVEMNDVAMMAVGLHASDEGLKRGLRQF